MRPLRLELEGFSSFREAVTVDFAADDLFVLTGPTGSGKSSLIDAMTFALYGSVPRYDDKRLVGSAVTQGKTQARVRFDFAVGGAEYTAVRVVRRTKGGGATTKEAVLQRGEDVLAAGAKELTLEVERLLGLSFDQFIQCVVLPQGDFAEFLHADRKDRQDILVKLLGLGVYDGMRRLASQRAAAARQRAETQEAMIAGLGELDDATLEAAASRAGELEKLLAQVDAALPELGRLEESATQQETAAGEAEADADRLEKTQVPPGLADLAARDAAADEALAAADRAREQVEEELAALRQQREGLGDPLPLQRQKTARLTLEAERRKLAVAEKSQAAAQKKADVGEAHAAQAAEALAAARQAREQVQREHAAHAVASTLEKNQPCPVCRQTVTTLPRRKAPAALKSVDTACRQAETAQREAEAAAKESARALAAAQQQVISCTERIAELQTDLKGAPSLQKIEAALGAIAQAEAAVKAAEQSAGSAREALATARKQKQGIETAVASAWKTYDTQRDHLARLEPPSADRGDLAASWTALAEWAAATSRARREQATGVRAEAATLRQAHADRLATLARAGAAIDVELETKAPRDGVFEALTEAKAYVARIEERRHQAAALAREIRTAKQEAAVAGSLAQHLRADGFERWLLDEALDRLVQGAAVRLRELSGGQYSLGHDGQGRFEVVDHRNADETRAIKTLSGGETFLASLSLALTLVDQLAELAAEGSARLESIFLDEGFGSLDPETLDVVAASIEELGAQDRVVGVVTHVRELAERIPVQYRVRKGPAGSTVERVAP